MKWILTIALILSSTTQAPLQVKAQTKQPVQPTRGSASPQQSTSRPVFVWPKTPARLSPVSGRRAGMGSRDNCPAVANALTALIPLREEQRASKQTKSISGIVEGLTTSERPTFWFYIPYTKDLTASAEFVLQDSAGNDIDQKAIALPAKPGVIDVSLPSTVASLQLGKTYRWYLKVRCNQQQTASVPIYVEGDIRRVNLDSSVMQQLQAAVDPRQKVKIYAANGIWVDALSMLAQLRQKNPTDASLAADWQSLLHSVNLDNFATAPLVN